MARVTKDTLSSRETLVLLAGVLALAVPVAISAVGAPAPQAPPQTAITSAPKFDVASVKQNKSGDSRMGIGLQPGGRFSATNATVRNLVRFAYQLQDFQLVGGPDWLNSERFNILAQAGSDVPPGQPGTIGPVQLMLRALLAERFGLIVRPDTRTMPIYALVVARPDGKLGPRLSASSIDCVAMMAAARGGGAAPPAPGPGQRPVCGLRTAPGQIMAGGFPLSQLTLSLSGMVQRVVIDRTGLSGNYDLELTFTPDQMSQVAQPPGGQLSPVDPNGPSIFTALQEQLGLKLDSQNGPVDVMVIDRVERPTED